MTLTSSASRVDNIRHSLASLKMPRALEMLDATLRRIERGEIDGIDAIDDLLTEEQRCRSAVGHRSRGRPADPWPLPGIPGAGGARA